MIRYEKHYYGGEWQTPSTSDTIDVISSATEEIIGRVPRGSVEDVDRAAKAARAGFERWSQTSAEERAVWLENSLVYSIHSALSRLSHSGDTQVAYGAHGTCVPSPCRIARSFTP